MNAVDSPYPMKTHQPWWRAAAERFAAIEPHQVRGPFTRWPRTADVTLVVVVFVVSVITVTASALDDGESFTIADMRDLGVGPLTLLAVAAGALVWRRRHAVGVVAVTVAVTVAWSVAGYGDGHDVAVLVASYGVGRYVVRHDRSMAIIAAVSLVSFLGTVIDAHQRVHVAPALLLAWIPWYVGRRVRNRRDYLALLQDRAVRVEAERLRDAREAVAAERARIARELHDVVAHQVSMMTVQAGAAKTIARDDLEVAIDAMADVERAGRQTLGELRHLLGVLRPEAAAGDDLGPQPGLDDIGALVAELGATGADVTFSISERPEHLSAAVELSAYRIVQESLTNVLKHAGPRPAVDVVVTVGCGELIVEVTNTTDGVPPALPGSGFGLAGMRERVALLGGTLRAGPSKPHEFCVRAELPIGDQL